MFQPTRIVALATVVTLAAAVPARAQERPTAREDSLARALSTLTARLDSLEAGLCVEGPVGVPSPTGANARGDSLARALGLLAERVERLGILRCAPARADSAGDLAALRAAADSAAGVPAVAPAAAGVDSGGVRPRADPGSGPRNANVFNPEISVTGDVRLAAREGSPQTDNATLREVEVAMQSALDPYSTAKVFFAYEDGEVDIEEAYIYWSGLPGRIRADVGKFRQQLGDLNRWHAHALPEAEYPLVYQRFLGEEGLAGIGISLYTPLPFALAGGTHEIWLQATTSESEPLYAGGRQPTLLGRLQNFWQLSRSTYAQIGVTATGGNNADAPDGPLRSRLAGLDFRLTWRPPESGTRRDVTFRAEGYRLHSNEAGTVRNRYGAFADLTARVSRRWVLSTRYDRVDAPRGLSDIEWRITPAITWWQSEFVFLRLQGAHRDSELEGSSRLLQLQVVWAMGPHKHETY